MNEAVVSSSDNTGERHADKRVCGYTTLSVGKAQPTCDLPPSWSLTQPFASRDPFVCFVDSFARGLIVGTHRNRVMLGG